MIKKSKLLKMLLAVFVIIVFTATIGVGCKTTTTAETTAAATTAVETTAAATTAAGETTAAAETTAAPSFQGRTLTIWTENQPGQKWNDLWAQLAADYEKERGAKVNFVSQTRNIAANALQPALLSGDIPDMIDVHISEAFTPAIEAGNSLELSDFFMEPSWDSSTTVGDTMIKGILDVWPLEAGSRYYAPYTGFTSGFFYNKTDFDKKGFTVPKTWAEFFPILDAYKAEGIAPFTQDGGIDFYNAYWIYWFINRYAGTGVLWDTALDKTGAKWDNPDLLKAAEALQNLSPGGKDYFIKDFNGYVFPAGQTDWAVGKAAFVLVGNWVIEDTVSIVSPEWNYGFFPFPMVEGNKGTTAENHPYGWIVMKDSKNIDLAKDFIKFSLSQKWQANLMTIGLLPSTTGLESMIPDVRGKGALADIFKMYSESSGVHETYDKTQGYAEWFNKVLVPNDDPLLFGKTTGKQFIDNMKASQIEFYK